MTKKLYNVIVKTAKGNGDTLSSVANAYIGMKFVKELADYGYERFQIEGMVVAMGNLVHNLTEIKIGEKFNGDLIGLKGYEIQITGGTDKDGFPMHPQVHGMVRKKIILSHPPCFHPKRKGMRKRKMVAGNAISKNIAQINCKIINYNIIKI